jgi:hypothetical protein
MTFNMLSQDLNPYFQDARVLKMLAMTLPDTLALSPFFTHFEGHGGLKATVSDLHSALFDYAFVLKQM